MNEPEPIETAEDVFAPPLAGDVAPAQAAGAPSRRFDRRVLSAGVLLGVVAQVGLVPWLVEVEAGLLHPGLPTLSPAGWAWVVSCGLAAGMLAAVRTGTSTRRGAIERGATAGALGGLVVAIGSLAMPAVVWAGSVSLRAAAQGVADVRLVAADGFSLLLLAQPAAAALGTICGAALGGCGAAGIASIGGHVGGRRPAPCDPWGLRAAWVLTTPAAVLGVFVSAMLYAWPALLRAAIETGVAWHWLGVAVLLALALVPMSAFAVSLAAGRSVRQMLVDGRDPNVVGVGVLVAVGLVVGSARVVDALFAANPQEVRTSELEHLLWVGEGLWLLVALSVGLFVAVFRRSPPGWSPGPGWAWDAALVAGTLATSFTAAFVLLAVGPPLGFSAALEIVGEGWPTDHDPFGALADTVSSATVMLPWLPLQFLWLPPLAWLLRRATGGR